MQQILNDVQLCKQILHWGFMFCVSVCQAMGAPTAGPIVTKLGQQTLHIRSSKVIALHLRSEAALRPKLRPHVACATQAMQ